MTEFSNSNVLAASPFDSFKDFGSLEKSKSSQDNTLDVSDIPYGFSLEPQTFIDVVKKIQKIKESELENAERTKKEMTSNPNTQKLLSKWKYQKCVLIPGTLLYGLGAAFTFTLGKVCVQGLPLTCGLTTGGFALGGLLVALLFYKKAYKPVSDQRKKEKLNQQFYENKLRFQIYDDQEYLEFVSKELLKKTDFITLTSPMLYVIVENASHKGHDYYKSYMRDKKKKQHEKLRSEGNFPQSFVVALN